jgi:hypothetical protein
MLMLLRGEQLKIFLLCYMCCGGSEIRSEDVLELVEIGGRLHFSLQVFIPAAKGVGNVNSVGGVGVPLPSKVFRFDIETQLYTSNAERKFLLGKLIGKLARAFCI